MALALESPLNVPPVSVAAACEVLLAQFRHPALRRRATMLWGARGIGKSAVVAQVAAACGVPLVDLRLTTLEPVDLRGAILADERRGKTVWLPPEFLPDGDDPPEGVLFLDELTAAEQRLQVSAYSLILDRRVGSYRLPEGWMVVAAGNAAQHGAVSHDMGTALADRLVHLHLHSDIGAFLRYAQERRLAPEVMAFLRLRPDRLDDSAAQVAADRVVGASPRGWEDVSQMMQAGLPEAATRLLVQGRLGEATAAEFFGVLQDLRAGVDVLALLAAAPGTPTRTRLPRTLDALYAMAYGLVAACGDAATLARALDVLEELPRAEVAAKLPMREVQTLATELLLQRALALGFADAVLDHPALRGAAAAVG